jgi:hypothetical protein
MQKKFTHMNNIFFHVKTEGYRNLLIVVARKHFFKACRFFGLSTMVFYSRFSQICCK